MRVVEVEATVRKNLKHVVVPAENIRAEFTDFIPSRDSRQMLQEQSADTVALIFIEHREGDFRSMRFLCTKVPAYANEQFTLARFNCSSQAHMINEIQLRKTRKVILGERSLDAEESVIDGLSAQPVKMME